MPRTVFEMTSNAALDAAARDLEDLGFVWTRAANRPTSTGPWLAVLHTADEASAVEKIVVEVDPAAVRQM